MAVAFVAVLRVCYVSGIVVIVAIVAIVVVVGAGPAQELTVSAVTNGPCREQNGFCGPIR